MTTRSGSEMTLSAVVYSCGMSRVVPTHLMTLPTTKIAASLTSANAGSSVASTCMSLTNSDVLGTGRGRPPFTIVRDLQFCHASLNCTAGQHFMRTEYATRGQIALSVCAYMRNFKLQLQYDVAMSGLQFVPETPGRPLPAFAPFAHSGMTKSFVLVKA